MHFLGLNGLPRRIPDYPDAYEIYDIVATFGSLVSVYSMGIFFFMLVASLSLPVLEEKEIEVKN
jgi:heme/copper-type cytochrome/quinol oxidase subunit 1